MKYTIPERLRYDKVMERIGTEHTDEINLVANMLSGTSRDAYSIAKDLIYKSNTLVRLAQYTLSELQTCGLTAREARVLKAGLELGKRMMMEKRQKRKAARHPSDVAALFAEHRTWTQEQFCLITLNAKNDVIRKVICTVGTVNASLVHPRDVFKHAIADNACAIILFHNHPSGDFAPSAEDVRITKQIIEAGKLMKIDVLDHVIGAQDHCYSMRDEGICEF